VVVANILSEQAFQVAFVNCDDVIQEITPATPRAESFHSRRLPANESCGRRLA
jgi:hypothetical protein